MLHAFAQATSEKVPRTVIGAFLIGREDEKTAQDYKGRKRHRHCFTEQTARPDRYCPSARHEMINQSREASRPDVPRLLQAQPVSMEEAVPL